MAVTLNAVMAAGNQGDTHDADNATSFSTTGITVAAGTDRVLIVVIIWAPNSGTGFTPGSRSVTWNGVSMTEAAFVTGSSGGTEVNCGIYVLVAPATGAQTLAGSWTNACDAYVSAIAFDGADQTTGINAANTVTGTDLTINVTGTSDGATVANHGRDGDEPTTVGQTKFWGYSALDPGGAGGYRIGLAGTNAYDFNNGNTGTHRATAAVNVIASAGPVVGPYQLGRRFFFRGVRR